MKNSPINKLQQLMVITMEECGELTQVCSKVIRKAATIDEIPEKDRQKLLEEAGDVYCMIELMMQHGILEQREVLERAEVKYEKLKQWSDLT